MKVHVQVTSEDIENGVRRDCWKCPVALALWRNTGVKWSVSGTCAYRLGMPGEIALFPSRVSAWIGTFDLMKRGPMPKPMEFDIDIDVEIEAATV